MVMLGDLRFDNLIHPKGIELMKSIPESTPTTTYVETPVYQPYQPGRVVLPYDHWDQPPETVHTLSIDPMLAIAGAITLLAIGIILKKNGD